MEENKVIKIEDIIDADKAFSTKKILMESLFGEEVNEAIVPYAK